MGTQGLPTPHTNNSKITRYKNRWQNFKIIYLVNKNLDIALVRVHIQNMDRGPWITPWTTPKMKIYRRSAYEKQSLVPLGLVFIAYVLEGLSCKSGLLWDRGPINGKTTNSFWDTEDLVHFYLQYLYSNTFKLQFARKDKPPLLIILYRA